MSKRNNKLSVWERYLTKEIGIEFKACLYFFCILFFYCVCKLIRGDIEASIIHMTEMILLTYFMGYIQVYLLSNFDEGDKMGIREIIYMIICCAAYVLASYVFGWFDDNLWVGIGFGAYMILVYVCAFLVYKSKRVIDEKLLNSDLKAFQERGYYGKCD